MQEAHKGKKVDLLLFDFLNKSNYDGRDKAFIANVVYLCQRNLRAIDDFILSYLSYNDFTNQTNFAPILALRIGVCMKYLNRPNHACVNEAVGCINSRKVRGFVNAIMRKIVKNEVHLLRETIDNAAHFSHPDFITEITEKTFPKEWKEVLKSNNETPNVSFVCIDEKAFEEVADYFCDEIVEKYPKLNLLITKNPRDFADSYLFKDGKFFVSNISSQMIVQAAQVSDGDKVLDVCAAPGGKTFVLSQRVGVKGQVIARDKSEQRLDQLEENITRLSQTGKFKNITTDEDDAEHPTNVDNEFDLVLVDAPCSGLGAIKRRVDLRWQLHPTQIKEMALLQKNIVDNAVKQVKIGGELVYSVCTYAKEETVDIESMMANKYTNFTPKKIDLELFGEAETMESKKGVYILPLRDFDGMYMVKYKRES